MNVNIVEVDPKKAETMLKRNDKNRSISQRHVKRLASEMANGHWVLNGQTISLSKDGRLLDGQHRLRAVIQSGSTILTAIAHGVEDDRAFQSYDQTMLKRGVHHIADMKGIGNPIRVTAVARRLALWDKTKDKENFSLASEPWRELTDHEVIEYIDVNNKEIQQILEEVNTSLPYKKCKARSSLVAALIICNRTDEVATLIFVEGLKTGANLPENSPVRLLRERLMFPPDRGGLKWDTEVMALTIKSWNKFFANKQLKTLRWIQKSDTPEYFPVPGGKR